MAIKNWILEPCNDMVTPPATSIPPAPDTGLLNISVTSWLEKLSDSERAIYEERAAIMEYDGGLTKEEAEKYAKRLELSQKTFCYWKSGDVPASECQMPCYKSEPIVSGGKITECPHFTDFWSKRLREIYADTD